MDAFTRGGRGPLLKTGSSCDRNGDPEAGPGGTGTTALRTALRIAVPLGILLAAIWLAETDVILAHVAAVSWPALAGMCLLHLLIVVLAAWRYAIVVRSAGARIGTLEVQRITFAATLANMLLPTALAGDAGRAWSIRRYGLTTRTAIATGLFDRVIGLVALGLVALAGCLIEPSIVPPPVAAGLCAVLAGLVLVVALWRDTPHRSGPAAPQGRARLLAVTGALSALGHLISVAIAVLFLRDQGIDLAVARVLALFPVVLLAASLPVSVGGWGTRELAAAAAFSGAGLDAPAAVAMAFMYGATQVIAAAAGTALYWLFSPGQSGNRES